MKRRVRIGSLAVRLRRLAAGAPAVAKSLWRAAAAFAVRLGKAFRPAALSAAARKAKSESVQAVRGIPGMFRKPPVTVEVRLGWCTRAGWNAPGTCVFFDIVNRGQQSVSIVSLGVSAVRGKDVPIAGELFRPALPYEIGARQRRVFSIPASDLVAAMGEHWVRLDLASVFVACAGDAIYCARLSSTTRDRLREEYYGSG